MDAGRSVARSAVVFSIGPPRALLGRGGCELVALARLVAAPHALEELAALAIDPLPVRLALGHARAVRVVAVAAQRHARGNHELAPAIRALLVRARLLHRAGRGAIRLLRLRELAPEPVCSRFVHDDPRWKKRLR